MHVEKIWIVPDWNPNRKGSRRSVFMDVRDGRGRMSRRWFGDRTSSFPILLANHSNSLSSVPIPFPSTRARSEPNAFLQRNHIPLPSPLCRREFLLHDREDTLVVEECRIPLWGNPSIHFNTIIRNPRVRSTRNVTSPSKTSAFFFSSRTRSFSKAWMRTRTLLNTCILFQETHR